VTNIKKSDLKAHLWIYMHALLHFSFLLFAIVLTDVCRILIVSHEKLQKKPLVKRSGGEGAYSGNSNTLGHTLHIKLETSSSDIVFHFLLTLGFLLFSLSILKLISSMMDGKFKRKGNLCDVLCLLNVC
jgi:hypothetical protein